jgi:hypothetical protein
VEWEYVGSGGSGDGVIRTNSLFAKWLNMDDSDIGGNRFHNSCECGSVEWYNVVSSGSGYKYAGLFARWSRMVASVVVDVLYNNGWIYGSVEW